MTPLAQAISRALIHFIWQGSIVGLSLWVILAALRKRSANSRYVATCAALGALAVMPVITASILYSMRSSPGDSAAAVARAQRRVDRVDRVSLSTAGVAGVDRHGPCPPGLGVLFFSGAPDVGYQHAFMLGRRGKPAGEGIAAVVLRLKRLMGIERPIRILISPIVETPSVVGWLRPVILLPAATLIGLTPLQLEAIVAHEIGHIKRYDYLVNMLQMLVETVLFYHPAVWWTSKRIRLERELCCDDLAVRASGNAMRYARALTTLERLRLRTGGVAMASTGGPLLYRIQRLAGSAAKEHGPSRLPALLAISLGVFCFALDVAWVRGQDAPGVKVDLGSSSVIHRSPVPYPEAAQKQGITGTVEVEVKLDATGNVADARVLTGPEELRKAALASVLDWHFTRDAARGTRIITISFSEQGKQVQVREVQTPQDLAVEGKLVTVELDGIQWKLENAKIAAAQAQLAESELLAQRREMEKIIGAKQRELEEKQDAPLEIRKEMEINLQELRKKFEAMPPAWKRNAAPLCQPRAQESAQCFFPIPFAATCFPICRSVKATFSLRS
jgi:TonB family protein